MYARQLALCVLLSVSVLACGSEGGTGPAGDAAGESDGVVGSFGEPCSSNKDCNGLKCDPIGGVCVVCLLAEDCGEALLCEEGQCVSPMACNPGGTGWLEPVPCEAGGECEGMACVEGQGCVPTPGASPCDDGNDCTEDACVPGEGCVHEWVSGCAEGGVADVTPLKVSFPPTIPAEQMNQETVTVSNAGLGPLRIFGLRVESQEEVFFVYTPPDTMATEVTFDEEILVEPGDAVEFSVAFLPQQLGEYEGTLVVVTNDVSKPDGEVEVMLAGEAVADNCLTAMPKSLNFGQVAAGVTHEMTVKLENCGDGLVPVFELTLTGTTPEAFALVAAVTPPFDLDEGQTTSITVGFTPPAAGKKYTGTLRVHNGAPKTPMLDIGLVGSGVAP